MNKVKLINSLQAQKWALRDGEIKHDSGRFYSIACYSIGGFRKLMIKQPEVSLLGLVYDPMSKDFLVQNKFEPGNIGTHLWTSTVQATVSNRDRVHGGKPVPYYDWFDTAEFDSEQSENGFSFYRKKNRNAFKQIVEIGSEDAFFWVPAQTICEALLKDFFFTTDARSALACSPWAIWLPESNSELYQVFRRSLAVDRISDEPMLSPIPEHHQLLVEDSDVDSPQIAWVDVETNMREVSRWQQPLLRGPHVCCHDLYVRINGILEFGFPEVTEPGIPHSMLGSSNEQVTGCAANGRILCEMWQSEEGSRFWKDVNQYRIVMVDCDTAQDLIWMSAGAMNRLTLKDMVFTGEARTLISLMLGALYQ